MKSEEERGNSVLFGVGGCLKIWVIGKGVGVGCR